MQDIRLDWTVFILIAVIALVIARPRNLNTAWPPCIGALVVLGTGLLSLSAIKTIFLTTWDASATLIALFILAETLNSNHFFDWAALQLARRSSGSGWKLYLYTLVLTAATAALFANDGAILILMPIFVTLLKKIYPNSLKDWLPYLFAAGFFADSMSALFIPSNLTNIIIADGYHLQFAEVAARMALPTAATFAVGGIAFAARFRKQIGTPYSLGGLDKPGSVIRDWPVFWAGIIALGILVTGYLVGGLYHLPTAAVALPVALFTLIIAHSRQLTKVQEVVRTAPWTVLLYALGMFVVITAAYDAKALEFITAPLQHNAGIASGLTPPLAVGSLTGILSAAVNNLPATLISVVALHSLSSIAPLGLYAVILGVTIGSKLTPFGSLSTLLWMGILKQNGISVSWGKYVKENWWVAVLTLAASLLTLYATSVL